MAKMVKIKWGERGKEPAAAAVGCSLSYHDSDVGNPLPAFTPRREPGFHLGIQNLRNTLVSPLDFFQLYFMPVLVDEIVQHTNPYACIEVAKENSNKRCNTECDGSWWDTTPAEILMLIGLLIYFGFVDIKGSANLVYVNFNSFLLFGGNQKISIVLCVYIMLIHSISKSFGRKNWFYGDKMIVFANLIYCHLVYVNLYSFLFFWGNQKISIILCVYIMRFWDTF